MACSLGRARAASGHLHTGFRSPLGPLVAMDVVEDVANTVVRQSTNAFGELAKQASVIGQLATADPIAWLAGEDDDGPDDLDRPPPLTGVPVAALRSWGHDAAAFAADASFEPSASSSSPSSAAASGRRPPPFAVDAALNGKIVLWEGDLCALEADALLAPSAAGFASGTSTVFSRIARYGGRELRADLKLLDPCRSGEARIVKAYALPSRHLVITVGPKYKDKYHEAAENTLNACYRESLQLLTEGGLRTIGIPCCWYTQGYPPEEQASVALRTLRKCLERLHQKIDTIVLVAATHREVDLYEALLPMYFPRNLLEAQAGALKLPDSCWNRWGEVTVEERRIRISSNLVSTPVEREDDGSTRESGPGQEREVPLFSAEDDADRGFLDAREDADTTALRRLEGTMIEAEDNDAAGQACVSYLRRAQKIEPEPEERRFIYRAGQDQFGRGIVVLLGKRLPSLGLRYERTLPLFVKELEEVRGRHFVLVYVNSGVPPMDTCCLEVLQEMLLVISARYRGAMECLIVLHPGLWFRAAFMLGRVVSDQAASVWNETVYVETVHDMTHYMPVDRLRLPQYVYEADAAL